MRGHSSRVLLWVKSTGSNSLLALPLPFRPAEAEGLRNHVSAGGEGAALQGDVGGHEPPRGHLPAGGVLLQVSLGPGAAQGGVGAE